MIGPAIRRSGAAFGRLVSYESLVARLGFVLSALRRLSVTEFSCLRLAELDKLLAGMVELVAPQNTDGDRFESVDPKAAKVLGLFLGKALDAKTYPVFRCNVTLNQAERG